ncbi:unnamed protein product [Caenorhabditis auriculariae]|uniref:FHA domain-containing protein n=1 Tax=Caenorhabditis auriculariae TaxID=2777116 RepID=A0A8S1GYT1_9PELO|nr:unnamed protein product [Caenorhabditis auriculariae]
MVFKSPALPPPEHFTTCQPVVSEIPVHSPVEREKESCSVGTEDVQKIDSKQTAKVSIAPPELSYKPPPWACQPDDEMDYKLEVLKDGRILTQFDMRERKHPTFIVIGRLPSCDVVLEHPSISRYHSILQFGEDTMAKSGRGWHIYDMGSTHGTKVNKNRLPPKQYIRLYIGHVLQFGGSTRLFNLLGPSSDCEPEWDCSPSEMKQKVQKKILEAKLAAAARQEIEEEGKREEESEGCNWGMDYGEGEKSSAAAVELDPHLMEDREAYYLQDPRKALTKFFEREGFDMNFAFSEQGSGHTHKWVCSIELPVEIDGVDRAFTASATVSTSKKDAQSQCALEACKILDAYGVLRRGSTKLRVKKKTLEANDYYEEDDDLYLDRTGQLEKQREKRRIWAEEGTYTKKVEKDTYDSLCVKLEQAKKDVAEIQQLLDALNPVKKEGLKSGGDALDDYVRQLENGVVGGDDLKTKTEKSMLRQKLVIATHDVQKLEKLVRIAKPVALPGLSALSATSGDKQTFLRKMLAARKAKEAQANQGPATKEASTVPPSIQIAQEEFTPETEEEDEKAAVSLPPPSSPGLVQETSGAVPFPLEPVVIKSEVTPTTDEMITTVATDSQLPAKNEFPPSSLPLTPKAPDIIVNVAQSRQNDALHEDEPVEKKKKVTRTRKRDEKKLAGAEDYGVGYDDRDEKYATWMPPENQSGDGTSALHAKFAGRY